MKEERINKIPLQVILAEYFIKPLGTGLFGFASFFTVIVISKWIGSFIGSIPAFDVEISDVTFSLLGFVFLLLISFLKNFQNYKEEDK